MSATAAAAAAAAESGQARMKAARGNYEKDEAAIDRRFRFRILLICCANMACLVANGYLLLVALERRHASLFFFTVSIVCDSLLYLFETFLLYRSGLRGGATRMYATLSDVANWPALRRYALCTESPPLALWHLVTALHLCCGAVVTGFHAFVYFSMTIEDVDFALAALLIHSVMFARLYYLLVTFYVTVVYSPVQKKLGANLKRYAASRARAINAANIAAFEQAADRTTATISMPLHGVNDDGAGGRRPKKTKKQPGGGGGGGGGLCGDLSASVVSGMPELKPKRI